MKPKDLVMKAISYESVPRIPVAVLDGYMWMLRRHNMSFQNLFDMEDEAAVNFALSEYEYMESDLIYANAQASGAVRAVMGGEADFSIVGAGPAVKKSALKELGDIRGFSVNGVFSKTAEHPLFASLGRQLEIMNRKAGDEKLILAFGTGPLTAAAGMVGMEPLLMALCDEDDDVRRILDFAVELTICQIKFQVAHGATAISIADPVSSINLISEEFFLRYTMPGLKRITSELKSSGLPVMLHICGDTTSRLAPLKDAGIDIFSVDSVDIKAAMEISAGSYAIFGNLNTVEIMLNGTSEEVYNIAAQRCGAVGLGGGFILAPGCDLPPDTPFENICAMVKGAHDCKGN